MRNSAEAGVATRLATRLSIAIMKARRIVPVTRLPSVRLTILTATLSLVIAGLDPAIQ
jgi:hypothetical protein